MPRIERLVRYLIDFALDEKYEISIPKGDEEIKRIVIDFEEKEIKIDPDD